MVVPPPPPLVEDIIVIIARARQLFEEKVVKNFCPTTKKTLNPKQRPLQKCDTSIPVKIKFCHKSDTFDTNAAKVDLCFASGNTGQRRRQSRRQRSPKRKRTLRVLVFAHPPPLPPRAFSSRCRRDGKTWCAVFIVRFNIIIIIIIIIIVPEEDDFEEENKEELWGVLLSSSSSSSSLRKHHHHHQSRHRRICRRLCAGETTVFHESNTTFVDAGVVVSNAALRGEE